MAQHWHTLWVKPHKERSVEKLLLAQNVEVFLPLVRVNPKNPRAARFRPYFPGYMFVYTDIDKVGVNRFNWVPGTHGLVGADGTPVIVSAQLIRTLEDHLSAIDKAGGLVYEDLKQGDKVRIKSGPFAGYEAIFDMRLSGQERVQVLLAFLSKYPQPVRLDSADIEKV